MHRRRPDLGSPLAWLDGTRREGAMGSLILLGTILAGVGLALATARISLALLVEMMPERKKV